ncbi:hypothetical protein [Denitrobaculum tricleocarpae]|uniref:Uncharacterized protein n=1 Tax=Denitrobaculum tricleocarpae TaxID=2591009 RepID=A0A545SY28_9PROT|nr:hypothetical protein [Denitrobaculum tricleocarpae]TQV69839.1 hypothetical protein FKG95_28590 [Denitrobaculum tricleocarpae]
MAINNNEIRVDDASDVLLSELVERGCLLHLVCPNCGKSSTTEGRFFGRRYEDVTFGEFLDALTCRRGGGCGNKGFVGEIRPRPVLPREDYAAIRF